MSTPTFEQFYHQCLGEEMMSATVFGLGASSDHGGEVPGGSDFYATGTAVIPKVLGAKKRKGRAQLPVQRRSLSKM